jgi:superfamily II DNA or RNA helicase
LKYGILQGYLSPIQCKRVFIDYDLSKVAVRMGDYSPQDLARQLNVESWNKAIAQAIAEVAELPAIIFAVDVEHAKELEKLIFSFSGFGN